jgi:hypothetical protein
MPEHSDFDGWIPRTVARKAVRIASHCDAIGAESYLVEYMSKLPPVEWRSRLWGSQIVAVVAGVRVDPSFVAESARAMQIRLWKEAHTPRDGALIHVRGNEVIYFGPLLWLPVSIEVSSPTKGVILPKCSALVIPNSLTFGDTRLRAEVRLGAISLRLRPLVEALRRDGYLVDLALDQLQKQGLLPATLVDSLSSLAPIIPSEAVVTEPVVIASEPKGPLKHRVSDALKKSSPLPDEGYEDWAKRALPNKNPHSVASILSKNKDRWEEAGGTPPKRGRKPALNYPR